MYCVNSEGWGEYKFRNSLFHSSFIISKDSLKINGFMKGRDAGPSGNSGPMRRGIKIMPTPWGHIHFLE